ncbi:hypothetical protein OTU49_010116 [Cherax quadricarinatus]|uniref:Patronin n=1 Tax=Cherax quadricarinatus TaxID=27406 RepID=A0AAW0WGX6_CHEQU
MGTSRRGSYDWEHQVVQMDEYDTLRAKQRASVAWIVQKAHKNKVPSDLHDPYYRDYEGAEHLKPGIVHRLANADLYCSALANIYGDPNFHNLSHWNIIQALARKGVYVAEPTDVALTETVLIQVSPIKMSAHLAVIEAMMALYIREVVVADRAVAVLQRVGGGMMPERIPQDQEEALVVWISHVTQALQERIHQQVQSQDQELPVFPRIQDLSDLSDGIGLAALISFYCPQELPWGDIAVADPPSIADSLYNIGLVIRFCQESLPYNPCLLTKEDIVYMHSSVKQNVLAFAAELFFLLELEPVSCVSLPGTKKTSTKFIQLSSPGRGGGKSPSSGGSGSGSGTGTGTGLRRQQSLTERDRLRRDRVSVHEGMKPAGAPSVRRSHSMNLNDMADIRSRIEQRTERSENAPSSYNSDYGGRDSSMSDGQEGDFVVQRSRGLATLSDMMRTQSPRPSQELETSYSSRSTTKEKYNMDSKEEELGERSRGLGRRGSFNNSHPDLPAAGMPSRYEERPHGRSRSRRNSISAEDSQLTIENFGGSQDNLNYISRNPDKEPFVHTGRRESSNVEGSQLRDSREGSARPESRNSRDRSIERRLDLHRGSIEELDNRLVDKLEREALEREKRDSSQYTSKERLIVRDPRKISVEAVDSGSESDASFDREKQMVKATSFAELSKLKEQLPGGINIIYMQSDKDDSSRRSSKSSEKKTTFAALPNQTTWKQQSAQSHSDDNKSISDENMEPQVMASELHNVRLKLEEKRRRIEAEKRKMEQAMNKQRQKLGKEAFMQAVVKGGKGSSTGSSTPTTSEPDALDTMVDSVEQCLPKHPSSLTTTATPPNPDLSLKDIGTDVTSLSRRWLEGENQAEELRTPDLDTMDYDQYHQSLTQMTDSLTEIQSDIQRLSHQQQQIQSLMHNGMNPPSNQAIHQAPAHGQFYLHDQQGSPVRRMWGQQPGSDGYASMSPATRRAQWGPARPMMPQSDYMMAGQHPNYYPGYQMSHPAQMPPLSQVNTQPQMGSTGQGFMLHGQPQSLPPQAMYQNGQGFYSPEHQFRGYPPNAQTYGSSDHQRQMGQTPPFRLHGEGTGGDGWGPGADSRGPGSLRSSAQSSPSRQPPQRQQKSPSPTRQTSVSHAPVAAPPPDDMEPQSVSFINSTDEQHSENQKDDASDKLKRLSISSGSKTYRISHEPGSPTRPSLGVKTFRVPTKKGTPIYDDVDLPQPAPPQRSRTPPYHQDTGGLDDDDEDDDEIDIKAEPLQEGPKGDKGFYISFESNSGPRKPKPQLRNKKMSRKNSSPSTPATTPSREDLPVVPSSASEMEKKKEKLMMMSMKRKQEQEEARLRKEMEAQAKREAEKLKEEEKLQKKEEEKARRQMILERYKIKKAMEEAEKEGRYYEPPPGLSPDPPSSSHGKPSVRLRNKPPGGSRPRPKTMAGSSVSDTTDGELTPSRGKKGSSQNIAGDYPSTTRTLDRGHTGRRPTSVIGYSSITRGDGRKTSRQSEHDSLVYHMSEDSGLGRATPPRRAPSPGMARHLPSPSGPGSLPPGLFSKRRQGGFDDAASDISSTASSTMDYYGPKLFKQPTAKSNRTIILNAVEYCVFPGMVNQTAKHRVLEEIARSESKHFLVLFRDSGCQFRAIYSFNPETEEVCKLYGTGPKQVNDRMFDKFFKYNSGGKCFSQIHTKHLTVTIDAFTIHNSLWQGKRVNLPSKKDMTLVI